MKKFAYRGECYPRGYRMAWFDYMRQRAVCYPFGIHVIAWAIHQVWHLSYWRLPTSEKAKLLEQIESLRKQLEEVKFERDAAEAMARAYSTPIRRKHNRMTA